MARLDPSALRVYVLTSSAFGGRSHHEVAAAAIAGGATAIQLRAPDAGEHELRAIATNLAFECRAAGVLFIVNDRPDVAREVGAHGAHVGQGDDLVRARDRLGPAGVLGVSVTDATQVGGAVACGADYLAVTVWATETKPEAVPGGLEMLGEVVRAAGVPVVGIGGIDPGNAPEVLDTGAAGVAVISAVADAEDPVAATRELVRVVETHAGRSA